jgi:hypothetical protein
MNKCEYCDYWQRHQPYTAAMSESMTNPNAPCWIAKPSCGYCLRYPPRNVPLGMFDRYPVTKHDDWCGEFKEAK